MKLTEKQTKTKYPLPSFLKGVASQGKYGKWLQRKAASLVKRDKKRAFKNISVQNYKEQIHDAVCRSKGKDAYTGDALDWKKISTYKDKKIPDLPSVDHCHARDGGGFKICSWAINDMKNDMSESELMEACRVILNHLGKK
jgi:hypothetical protein